MLSSMLAACCPELSKPRENPIHGFSVIIFLLLSHPPQSKFQDFCKQLFVHLSVFSLVTVRLIKAEAAIIKVSPLPIMVPEIKKLFSQHFLSQLVNEWMNAFHCKPCLSRLQGTGYYHL